MTVRNVGSRIATRIRLEAKVTVDSAMLRGPGDTSYRRIVSSGQPELGDLAPGDSLSLILFEDYLDYLGSAVRLSHADGSVDVAFHRVPMTWGWRIDWTVAVMLFVVSILAAVIRTTGLQLIVRKRPSVSDGAGSGDVSE